AADDRDQLVAVERLELVLAVDDVERLRPVVRVQRRPEPGRRRDLELAEVVADVLAPHLEGDVVAAAHEEDPTLAGVARLHVDAHFGSFRGVPAALCRRRRSSMSTFMAHATAAPASLPSRPASSRMVSQASMLSRYAKTAKACRASDLGRPSVASASASRSLASRSCRRIDRNELAPRESAIASTSFGCSSHCAAFSA